MFYCHFIIVNHQNVVFQQKATASILCKSLYQQVFQKKTETKHSISSVLLYFFIAFFYKRMFSYRYFAKNLKRKFSPMLTEATNRNLNN